MTLSKESNFNKLIDNILWKCKSRIENIQYGLGNPLINLLLKSLIQARIFFNYKANFILMNTFLLMSLLVVGFINLPEYFLISLIFKSFNLKLILIAIILILVTLLSFVIHRVFSPVSHIIYSGYNDSKVIKDKIFHLYQIFNLTLFISSFFFICWIVSVFIQLGVYATNSILFSFDFLNVLFNYNQISLQQTIYFPEWGDTIKYAITSVPIIAGLYTIILIVFQYLLREIIYFSDAFIELMNVPQKLLQRRLTGSWY